MTPQTIILPKLVLDFIQTIQDNDLLITPTKILLVNPVSRRISFEWSHNTKLELKSPFLVVSSVYLLRIINYIRLYDITKLHITLNNAGVISEILETNRDDILASTSVYSPFTDPEYTLDHIFGSEFFVTEGTPFVELIEDFTSWLSSIPKLSIFKKGYVGFSNKHLEIVDHELRWKLPIPHTLNFLKGILSIDNFRVLIKFLEYNNNQIAVTDTSLVIQNSEERVTILLPFENFELNTENINNQTDNILETKIDTQYFSNLISFGNFIKILHNDHILSIALSENQIDVSPLNKHEYEHSKISIPHNPIKFSGQEVCLVDLDYIIKILKYFSFAETVTFKVSSAIISFEHDQIEVQLVKYSL